MSGEFNDTKLLADTQEPIVIQPKAEDTAHSTDEVTI